MTALEWLQLWLQLSAFMVVRSSSLSFTPQLRTLTELQRTYADAIKINWQCGGQGFESLSSTSSEEVLLLHARRPLRAWSPLTASAAGRPSRRLLRGPVPA